MVEIKEATPQDVEIIHTLAHQIWPQVYAYMISPEQISYMLEEMYSLDALEKQMALGHEFFLLYHSTKPMGFCSFSLVSPEVARLHKLYLHPDLQKSGLGKRMLELVIQTVTERQAQVLELNVNRNNTSLGFYRHMGFEVHHEVDLDIGGGFAMNDYVLVKHLGESPL
jgi:GNAT superfamily N-acetyltransferase